MLRLAAPFAIALLVGPILFGLAATLLPALGYFPSMGGTQFSLEPFQRLFERPGLFQSAAISLASALVTPLVALASVAFFVAGWSGTRIFQKLQHFVSPLLSVPHAAAAFGLAFLIAPSGWILRIISPELTGLERPPDLLILHDPMGISMMIGLIVKEIPFLLLVTLAALPQIDALRNAQVARGLGYGRLAGFAFTAWPRLYPQIRLAVYAVVAYASGVVDVAIILGPNNPAPLSPRLLGWMNDPDIAMRFEASAGAMLQLGVTLLALSVWWMGEILLAQIRKVMCRKGYRFARDWLPRQISLIWICVSASVVFLGLIILAIWSFAGFWSFPDALPDAFTSRNWLRSLPGLGQPLFNSLVIGGVATLLAISISLACLEHEVRVLKTNTPRALLIIYLPLLVPQTGFVFGLQIFFLWLDLDATLLAVILVHLVFVFPYVFLSLSAPWRAWDMRYRSIAHGFGASDNKVFWKIRFPMMMRAILVAMAVGFAVSIGQYLPTVLIGAGRQPTITTEAVALASGGDRRIIGVYAFLQMLLPFAGFALATMIPAILFRNRIDMKAA